MKIKTLFIGRQDVCLSYAHLFEKALTPKGVESDWIIANDPEMGLRLSEAEEFQIIFVDEYSLPEAAETSIEFLARLSEQETPRIVVLASCETIVAETMPGADYVFAHRYDERYQKEQAGGVLQCYLNTVALQEISGSPKAMFGWGESEDPAGDN